MRNSLLTIQAVALSALAGSSQEQPRPTDPIETCLVAARQAIAVRDAQGFLKHLNLSQLIATMEGTGIVTPANLPRLKAMMTRGAAQFAKRSVDPSSQLGWERHQVLGRTIDDSEAIVRLVVRHWNMNESSSKMRWGLSKTEDGSAWRIFDWEPVGFGMRMSTMLALMLEVQSNADEKAREAAHNTFMGFLLLGQEDHAGARSLLERVDEEALPQPFVPFLLYALCVTTHALDKDPVKAIDYGERALALSPSMTLLHIVVAECRTELEEYDDARTGARRYLEENGEDDLYCRIMAECELGNDDFAQAAAAFAKAIAFDPFDDHAIAMLAWYLPDERKDEFVPHDDAYPDKEHLLEVVSAAVIAGEDAAALRTLITAHAKHAPKLDELRRTLKELEGGDER